MAFAESKLGKNEPKPGPIDDPATSLSLSRDQMGMLPKDKHDNSCMTRLLEHSPKSDLIPLLPELLTWLQDINWPIFGSAVEVLLSCTQYLQAPLSKILRGDDEAWIYYCLSYLLREMPQADVEKLRGPILDLKTRTARGWGEDWEMAEVVDEIIAKIDA